MNENNELYKVYICLMLLMLTGFLEGCSTKDSLEIPDDNYIITGNIDLDDSEFVKRELYEQGNQWKGTRYCNGGLSKSGIDCSGFVYITFKHRFGIVLPRSTEEMAEIGSSVSYGEWRAGDLVFFRTGIVGRHVGIYVERGQFLHVSSSQGVKISLLSNSYWRKNYWKAKRI